MRLLVLSPWFPCPPDNGSRQRAYHLIRCWAEAGHTIHLVAGLQTDFADHADYETLQRLCCSVQVFPWQWHDSSTHFSVRTLLSPVPRSISNTDNPLLRAAMATAFQRKPDACIAMELAAAPFIPFHTNGVPVILDQVEMSNSAQSVQQAIGGRAKLRALLTQAKHDRYWRTALKRFTVITTVSREEADAVRNLVPDGTPPVCVVRNGVDTKYYRTEDRIPQSGRIVYNGSLTYTPNREAVTWFVEEILPRIAHSVPDAHLVVTGRISPDVTKQFLGNDRVSFTGFVPDIRPVLATAAVCVVPLRTGGGTRLKILEAWAAGVPVISTAIGAKGLENSVGGAHLSIADSAERFADGCLQLMKDTEMAQRLAQNARSLVEERYDWDALAEQVIGLTRIPH